MPHKKLHFGLMDVSSSTGNKLEFHHGKKGQLKHLYGEGPAG